MSGNIQPTVVLGFGVTGASVVRHLRRQGDAVVVLDTRPPRDVADEFADVDIRFGVTGWPGLEAKRVILSPGLSLESCLVLGALAAGIEVVSDIDVFFECVDAPVIGITGTNGKSTVTAWTGHALNRAGIDAAVGGNIGDAALDLLAQPRDCYVLELSSFQLERSRLHHYAAVCILNVSEDHLDAHGDMDRYLAAKHRIFADSNLCVYSRHDPMTVPNATSGNESPAQPSVVRTIGIGPDAPRGEDFGIALNGGVRSLFRGARPIVATQDLSLQGAHNELNALAVCALICDMVPEEKMAGALAGFTSLPHRFARVAKVDGVTYINDSKATNVGATVAALEGMPADNKVLLIAGGDAKGVSLEPLAGVMANRVREVFAIGQDANQVSEVAASIGTACTECVDLKEAVRAARSVAAAADVVLLSPACSSLDMFPNYAARGDVFESLVRRLEVEGDV